MAKKYKRTVVGSVLKSKTAGKPAYIQIGTDVVLKKGQYLNLESKEFQLKGIDQAVADSKIPADVAEQARERINKIPPFVMFQIVLVEKNAE